MAIVSPSILSADFGKLGADCRMVLDAGAQMLHYDVMDGHFVPNISFGVPVLKSLHKNLPDAFYDVHLMISHPLQYAEAFIKAGATLYNFHLECEDDIQATIDAVRALGCKVGLTIKPGTEPQALAPYLDQLDLVLVMSVEPGFGGQKFNEELAKAAANVSTGYKFLPFEVYARGKFGDYAGDAYTGKTTLSDAVASWQKDLQDYAKQQGYQVK